MIWTNGLTWEEKKRRKAEWHTWFAWRPIVVNINNGGRKIMVWLEFVERSGKCFCDFGGWFM